MTEQTDKLTIVDVKGLTDRANTPLLGPASAAQETLEQAVKAGEGAFADQAAFAAAQHVVTTFFRA